MSTSSDLIPIFHKVADYRRWREEAFYARKSVGYVATMGALHDGHLNLVKRSLAENDLTVVSIFVNPAQFAPHEDLSSYPRTLPRDVELLSAQIIGSRSPDAVFAPLVSEMYPSGITQVVADQKGTFVEVKGYSHQMEGASRPTFFRGVATVVTKLFNIIQPTNTYFGQKDIQQALLLRRMVRDLLLANPTPETLHIVPTSRIPSSGLALSSRNAYLSPEELKIAPALYVSLSAAATAWKQGATKGECVYMAMRTVDEWKKKGPNGVEVNVLYIELNDAESFEALETKDTQKALQVEGGKESTVILSGAMTVGKTRLIDNIILGQDNGILY